MYQVQCPVCRKLRDVKAKKSWMTGEEPYQNLCKTCCQVGKEKSPEHRAKLSESVKAAQTPELRANKSQFMLEHPEVWEGNIATGNGGGWNKEKSLPPRSDSTKAAISETMKSLKIERKKNES